MDAPGEIKDEFDERGFPTTVRAAMDPGLREQIAALAPGSRLAAFMRGEPLPPHNVARMNNLDNAA